MTFIWDVAEAISIVKRGGNRGIHPGAVVAVDLILWLGWAIVDLVMLTSGLVLRSRYLIQDYSGYDYPYTYNTSKVTAADTALEKVIAGKGRAMFAFGLFTLYDGPCAHASWTLLTLPFHSIIHFALFVIACTETNKRKRMTRTVYVMQPMYGPPQVIVPAAYQQLGAFPPQPQPGQYPSNPMYMPPPGQMYIPQPGQMPVQPPPATLPTETKTTGAERFA